jgi:hypothetical protein
MPTIPELEQLPSQRLDALPLAARAELLHVLMLPDFERAARIGEFWSYPPSRTFAELLIECEEDRTLRAVLVGMLREMDLDSRKPPHRPFPSCMGNPERRGRGNHRSAGTRRSIPCWGPSSQPSSHPS